MTRFEQTSNHIVTEAILGLILKSLYREIKIVVRLLVWAEINISLLLQEISESIAKLAEEATYQTKRQSLDMLASIGTGISLNEENKRTKIMKDQDKDINSQKSLVLGTPQEIEKHLNQNQEES